MLLMISTPPRRHLFNRLLRSAASEVVAWILAPNLCGRFRVRGRRQTILQYGGARCACGGGGRMTADFGRTAPHGFAALAAWLCVFAPLVYPWILGVWDHCQNGRMHGINFISHSSSSAFEMWVYRGCEISAAAQSSGSN